MTTWVIVADASRARIFSAEKSFSALEQVEEIHHPEGRLHDHDFGIDSNGDGRQAMGREVPPKKHEATRFAKALCDRLNNARATGLFEKLYVVASPAFLGTMRQCMNEVTQKSIVGELDKNLTTHDTETIRSHLPNFL